MNEAEKLNNQQGNGVLPCVSGSASHTWDKEKGIKVAGKPWVGIKGKTVRTCMVCGKNEYWTNDGMFCGWFSIP